MFGNLKGWLISGVIVVVTAGFILLYGRPETISPPSGRFAYAVQPLSLPVDPGPLVPAGTQDCDAGDLYRQAAESVKANHKRYEAFDHKPSLEAAQGLEALDLLLKARDCGKMTLFAKKPAEVVNYDNSKPILPELQQAARIAVHVGALYGAKDPQKAKQYFDAAFVLGRNLYNERQSFDEYRIGTEAMSNAAGMMSRFGPDTQDKARVDALKKFVDGVGEYQDQKIKPLWQAVSGIAEDREGAGLPTPGDMFLIAESPTADPMWRAEAILKLGRMRYMKEVTYADQVGANRAVKQLADRSDLPQNVKAAARQARDLSVEKFRMYGGGT